MRSTPRFELRPLARDESPQIQRFLEDCADYIQLVLGRPPTKDEANDLFEAGPEDGRPPDNKILLGIQPAGSDELIGVLDGFRDYPEPAVWYIGLLMLRPNARRAGAGREIVEAFVDEAACSGASAIEINVVDQNTIARQFWQSCGFAEVRRWRQHYGSRESEFIRMSLTLPRDAGGRR